MKPSLLIFFLLLLPCAPSFSSPTSMPTSTKFLEKAFCEKSLRFFFTKEDIRKTSKNNLVYRLLLDFKKDIKGEKTLSKNIDIFYIALSSCFEFKKRDFLSKYEDIKSFIFDQLLSNKINRDNIFRSVLALDIIFKSTVTITKNDSKKLAKILKKTKLHDTIRASQKKNHINNEKFYKNLDDEIEKIALREIFNVVLAVKLSHLKKHSFTWLFSHLSKHEKEKKSYLIKIICQNREDQQICNITSFFSKNTKYYKKCNIKKDWINLYKLMRNQETKDSSIKKWLSYEKNKRINISKNGTNSQRDKDTSLKFLEIAARISMDISNIKAIPALKENQHLKIIEDALFLFILNEYVKLKEAIFSNNAKTPFFNSKIMSAVFYSLCEKGVRSLKKKLCVKPLFYIIDPLIALCLCTEKDPKSVLSSLLRVHKKNEHLRIILLLLLNNIEKDPLKKKKIKNSVKKATQIHRHNTFKNKKFVHFFNFSEKCLKN